MKNTRHIRMATLAAVGLAMGALLAGCSPSGTASTSGASSDSSGAPAPAVGVFPVTVSDDLQRPITIDSQPKRLISLAPANTEILYALGKLDSVVGLTTYDDYPARVRKIPKVGDFVTPNMEAITAARPDVIFVTGGVQAETVAKLTGLGAKVIVVDPKNLEGLYASIVMVGDVVGAPAKASSVVAGMKKDLKAIRDKIGSEAPVSCFIEIGWNPLYTAGPGTLMDDMIKEAGGKNVVKAGGYLHYSVERLLVDQPTVYFGTKSSLGDGGTVAARTGYKRLGAVESGRVVPLDDDVVSRPGPRIVLGVRKLAVALHPDRF